MILIGVVELPIWGRVAEKLIDWCLLTSQSSGSTRLVLVALIRATNGESKKIHIDDLCFMTGLSRSTVKTSLRLLQGFDEIEIESGGGRGNTNTYSVKAPKFVLPTSGDVNGDTFLHQREGEADALPGKRNTSAPAHSECSN